MRIKPIDTDKISDAISELCNNDFNKKEKDEISARLESLKKFITGKSETDQLGDWLKTILFLNQVFELDGKAMPMPNVPEGTLNKFAIVKVEKDNQVYITLRLMGGIDVDKSSAKLPNEAR